jgi:hypothetical protein
MLDSGAGEIRPPALTTDSEEVKLSGLLKALEPKAREETRPALITTL